MRGLAAIALALLGGCFSPSFGDGQFVCGPAGDCPPGFTCDSEGICVRDPVAPDPIDAAAPVPDAPPAPVPDAAAPPDAARPPQPARVYVFDTDAEVWSHDAATTYFSGAGAPVADEIQTAWAHCAAIAAPILCVGTSAKWYCTDDGAASWYGATWGDVIAGLETHPPTFTTAFDTSTGFLKEVWFTSEERWWEGRYFERPTRVVGTAGEWTVMIATTYEADGRDVRAVEWDGVANAPPSGAAITADYQRDGAWLLWTADGVEYSFEADEWKEPGPAPSLSQPGAPPPDLVTAAFQCGDDLYVITRSG